VSDKKPDLLFLVTCGKSILGERGKRQIYVNGKRYIANYKTDIS